MENIKETILAVVLDVVQDKSPETETVKPEQALVEDLGLQSLDLARIVAKLEVKLGVDPFAELVAITSIRTPGDLTAAYSKCFSTDSADADAAGEAAADESPAPRSRARLASQRELRQKARGE